MRINAAYRDALVPKPRRGVSGSFRFAHGSQHAGYAANDTFYISRRGLPVADADAHGPFAAPGGVAKQRFSGGSDFFYHAIGELIVLRLSGMWEWAEEANKALIDLRPPKQFRAGQRGQTDCKGMRMGTGALHECGDALPPKLA